MKYVAIIAGFLLVLSGFPACFDNELEPGKTPATSAPEAGAIHNFSEFLALVRQQNP